MRCKICDYNLDTESCLREIERYTDKKFYQHEVCSDCSKVVMEQLDTVYRDEHNNAILGREIPILDVDYSEEQLPLSKRNGVFE